MKHPGKLLERIKERLECFALKDPSLMEGFTELEELLLFYHEIITKCPVAIYVSDAENRKLLWANERSKDVLGKDCAEFGEQGAHFLDEALHPQDQEDIRKRVKQFQVYPNQVQEGAYRVKDEHSKKYHWKYALVTSFARKEGKPYKLMSASFNLNEALQDRLNFYEHIKEQSQANDPVSMDHLTCREKEILTLIVRGFTMREVAEQLKISHHTAGTHRKNLFKKTKVNKTSELVRFALKHGID